MPIREQHGLLKRKVQGHYAYYGIRGNMRSLQQFLFRVRLVWVKWLRRRSQRAYFSWAKADQLFQLLPLPAARIMQQC